MGDAIVGNGCSLAMRDYIVEGSLIWRVLNDVIVGNDWCRAIRDQ